MTAEPTPTPSLTGPWRVALVMIVRDEAARIRHALASALPWVDEAVVLDTGSRDNTMALARAAGARVHSFPWGDDFAAARNAALALAGADWHVVMDADEWIAEGGPTLAGLRQCAPRFVGALRVDSLQGDSAQDGTAPSWISRVLPGRVRYAGRIHEQPQHTLSVQRMPVLLGHAGYAPAALAAKAGRNARLLLAALREQPADAYLWYQLGKDHDVYERYADAIAAFNRAEALLSMPGAYPAWLHDLCIRRLHAMKRCGQHGQGLLLAEAELPRWRDSPDFFFALGDLLLDWAATEPSRVSALLPLIEQAWQQCLSLGERPDLEGAVAGRGSYLAAGNLALLYDVLKRPADASHCRQLAAQQPPAQIPAGAPAPLRARPASHRPAAVPRPPLPRRAADPAAWRR